MPSAQDLALINNLNSINSRVQLYFSYSGPWLGLALSTFALLALVLPERREKNLIIYILGWQYAIGVIYALNMLFNDPAFSQKLFGYTFKQSVSDPVCKLSNMLLRLFYCASPWMQVVLTFDRLWSVYLENKLGIKRNKITVTFFILMILTFVFLVDQLYMAYYVQNTRTPYSVFNKALNKTVTAYRITAVCVQYNSDLVLAQDLVFLVMRILLPFIIMTVCNAVLISHIRKSRQRIVHGRDEKKERSFTMAVVIMNVWFLVCNIGAVVYFIVFYYMKFTGLSWPLVPFYINSLYGACATLLSYVFTLSQFFIDMIFNKIFRKEMISALTGRRNQVDEARGNTNNDRENIGTN